MFLKKKCFLAIKCMLNKCCITYNSARNQAILFLISSYNENCHFLRKEKGIPSYPLGEDLHLVLVP